MRCPASSAGPAQRNKRQLRSRPTKRRVPDDNDGSGYRAHKVSDKWRAQDGSADRSENSAALGFCLACESPFVVDHVPEALSGGVRPSFQLSRHDRPAKCGPVKSVDARGDRTRKMLVLSR